MGCGGNGYTQYPDMRSAIRLVVALVAGAGAAVGAFLWVVHLRMPVFAWRLVCPAAGLVGAVATDVTLRRSSAAWRRYVEELRLLERPPVEWSSEDRARPAAYRHATPRRLRARRYRAAL